MSTLRAVENNSRAGVCLRAAQVRNAERYRRARRDLLCAETNNKYLVMCFFGTKEYIIKYIRHKYPSFGEGDYEK